VRKLEAVPKAAVALRTTAVAVAGTPSLAELPATTTGNLEFAGIARPCWRVPSARLGDRELYNPLPSVEEALV
jgi:hypothetical protein